MITCSKLNNYLHEYLACGSVEDYAPNGMQIEGRDAIHMLCTAVTASFEVIQNAVRLQDDALLVHHGYFWRGEDLTITGMKKRRIEQLLNHNINLFAYHLPLDCHLDVGNNACLAELLNFTSIKSHKIGKVDNLLWSGELIKPQSPKILYKRLTDKLNRKPEWINNGNKIIKRVAWCTGAAQDFIEQAAALGMDAYISGEISERTYYQARELGVHYFACGHNATERYGVQALGRYLSTKFDLQHHFIDSDNPV